jgi:hypothetical protein
VTDVQRRLRRRPAAPKKATPEKVAAKATPKATAAKGRAEKVATKAPSLRRAKSPAKDANELSLTNTRRRHDSAAPLIEHLAELGDPTDPRGAGLIVGGRGSSSTVAEPILQFCWG